MGRALGYFITQGFRNIRTHRLVSLASVGIVAASLFLLGIFMLLEMNINSILSQLQNQYEINIYIKSNITTPQRKELESQLNMIEDIADYQYYTKDERLQAVKESTYRGKEYLLEDFEKDNPLRDSYVITLKNLDRAEDVADQLKKIDGVDEVSNAPEIAGKIQQFSNGAEQVGFWMMLLFALAALFIISNTIRMGMVARSREIEIMHFVGASSGYIRGPFLVEGMILGLFGALLASVAVVWGYSVAANALQNGVPEEILEVVKPLDAAKAMIPVFLGLGMGIGLFGSGFSVHKYKR